MQELKVFVIDYSDIDSIAKYDFGNDKFEITEYMGSVCSDMYKLYKNVGNDCKTKKDDINFKELMEGVAHFLQTNDENSLEKITGYCGVKVEWILECLVYHKCLMSGNYLIRVYW